MKFWMKLAGISLALALLPLLVISYLAYDNARQTIEQNTFRHLTAVNDLKAAEFARWMEGNAQILRLQANRPLVAVYSEVLATHDASDAEYENAKTRLIEDHLLPAVNDVESFHDLFLIRVSDGLIVAGTDPRMEGKYRESEPYFLEGQLDTFIDEVKYEVSLGAPALHFSSPVRDESGEVIAVLVGHANVTEMTNIMLQGSEQSVSQDTYLVNTFNFFVTDSRYLSGSMLSRSVYSAGVTECLQGRTGVAMYSDFRAVPVMGAYRWLPERHLCIITEIEQAEAFAPIIALRRFTMLVSGIAALVIIAAAAVFARTITRPIARLVEGTQAIRKGDMTVRVTIDSRDELGDLAQAFNRMMEDLANAQVELRKSEEQYRSLIESSEASISTVDENGLFHFMNHKAAHQLGAEPEDLLGRRMHDLFPPQIADRQLAAVKRVIQSGEGLVTEEISIVQREQRWYRTSVQPILDNNGVPILALVNASDVTDRKKAEADLQLLNQTLEQQVEARTRDLQDSEERFRRAVTDAPFPIMMQADDGEILLISRSWSELTGYELQDIPTITHWVKSAYGERHEEVLQEIIRLFDMKERISEGEYAIRTKDGRRLVWDFSSAPLGMMPDGRRCILSMAVDVTKRKQAEQALAVHEANQRALLNAILESVLLMERDGRLVLANETFAERFGCHADELIGTDVFSLLPQQAVELRRTYVEQVIETGKPARFEDQRFGRTIDNSIYPVFDEVNAVTRLAVYGRDITEQKKAEAELRQALQDLERSNEELQRFAYVASHDLQEPLRMVASYVQLLRKRYQGQLGDDADEFIYYAVDGVERMKKLINDLLQYSRVTTRVENFKTVDLNSVLDRIMRDFSASIKETGAVITHDPLPIVVADDTQMGQLLGNLIGNAIKFHGDHPPMIHISVKDHNTYWEFSVADNGIGIEEEFFNRIFIIFQRLHPKQQFPGTGIGLAICKRIVERHNGRIWVEAKPNVGSTFYFTLPKRRGE